jgi:type II secretion system protein J
MKRRAPSGFTLFEVMIAVTLLGVVLTAVYGIWSAGLRGWRRSGAMVDALQRERIVFGALEDLTQSAVFMRSDKMLYELRGVRGDAGNDSISFVTASDAFLPPAAAGVAGMRRVTLSLAYDEYRQPYLGIVNAAAVAEEPTEPVVPRVLSTDVTAFSVRYRHPQTGAWQDEWSERNLLPAGIEYTITFAAGSGAQAVTVQAKRLLELPMALYVARTGGLSPTVTRTGGGRGSGTGKEGGGSSRGPVPIRPGTPAGAGGPR